MKHVLLLIALLVSNILVAQEHKTAAPISVAPISVTFADGKSIPFDEKALAALPRISETATAHEKTATYEGCDLRELLRVTGVTPLESLRGAALRRVITIVAADGYRAVFALSELDPSIGAKRVLLANRENDAALPDADGPWRLVVASDKRPARWVRQVTGVIVSDLP